MDSGNSDLEKPLFVRMLFIVEHLVQYGRQIQIPRQLLIILEPTDFSIFLTPQAILLTGVVMRQE